MFSIIGHEDIAAGREVFVFLEGDNYEELTEPKARKDALAYATSAAGITRPGVSSLESPFTVEGSSPPRFRLRLRVQGGL